MAFETCSCATDEGRNAKDAPFLVCLWIKPSPTILLGDAIVVGSIYLVGRKMSCLYCELFVLWKVHAWLARIPRCPGVDSKPHLGQHCFLFGLLNKRI
jgi:hypothetical protein